MTQWVNNVATLASQIDSCMPSFPIGDVDWIVSRGCVGLQ
jgi:hypothetical protein